MDCRLNRSCLKQFHATFRISYCSTRGGPSGDGRPLVALFSSSVNYVQTYWARTRVWDHNFKVWILKFGIAIGPLWNRAASWASGPILEECCGGGRRILALRFEVVKISSCARVLFKEGSGGVWSGELLRLIRSLALVVGGNRRQAQTGTKSSARRWCLWEESEVNAT